MNTSTSKKDYIKIMAPLIILSIVIDVLTITLTPLNLVCWCGFNLLAYPIVVERCDDAHICENDNNDFYLGLLTLLPIINYVFEIFLMFYKNKEYAKYVKYVKSNF